MRPNPPRIRPYPPYPPVRASGSAGAVVRPVDPGSWWTQGRPAQDHWSCSSSGSSRISAFDRLRRRRRRVIRLRPGPQAPQRPRGAHLPRGHDHLRPQRQHPRAPVTRRRAPPDDRLEPGPTASRGCRDRGGGQDVLGQHRHRPHRHRLLGHRYAHRRSPRRLHHHPAAGPPEAVARRGHGNESSRLGDRKIKEILQSIRVTDYYRGEEGKQRILTAYLNQNFYGNNSYGVSRGGHLLLRQDGQSQVSLSAGPGRHARGHPPGTLDLRPRAQRHQERRRPVGGAGRTRPSISGATSCCSCSRTTPPAACSVATQYTTQDYRDGDERAAHRRASARGRVEGPALRLVRASMS